MNQNYPQCPDDDDDDNDNQQHQGGYPQTNYPGQQAYPQYGQQAYPQYGQQTYPQYGQQAYPQYSQQNSPGIPSKLNQSNQNAPPPPPPPSKHMQTSWPGLNPNSRDTIDHNPIKANSFNFNNKSQPQHQNSLGSPRIPPPPPGNQGYDINKPPPPPSNFINPHYGKPGFDYHNVQNQTGAGLLNYAAPSQYVNQFHQYQQKKNEYQTMNWDGYKLTTIATPLHVLKTHTDKIYAKYDMNRSDSVDMNQFPLMLNE